MNDVRHALSELVPDVRSVESVQYVSGGCISDARRISVRNHAGATLDLFVKSNNAVFLENFQAESDGLARLAAPGVIGVPKPIALGVVTNQAWLVTEWIEPGQRGPDFFADFGQTLAQHHQVTVGSQIGLDRDNYLGAARQINTPRENWVEFVAEQRIGYQIRWAVDQGLADHSLRRDGELIMTSMAALLEGRDRSTSLLHGDLWSGNYLCDDLGDPVIIDPAIYHGCREAEFGMLRLFGGCPESFYESYQEAFPLPDGWQRRVSVYVLYHLLNHLNLFGGGYLSQCRSLAAELLSQ